ncbi:hypothetical protein JCM3774_002896 [Rhodotorula dairenensis]
MPAHDRGQYDLSRDQSQLELDNPLTLCLDPTVFATLHDAHETLSANIPHPSQLHKELLKLVKPLSDLYARLPNTPTLYKTSYLVSNALPRQAPDSDTPRKKIGLIQLACAKESWPGCLPWWDDRAPKGPTVNFLRDEAYWEDTTSEREIHVIDCAEVCISKAIEARSIRLGYKGTSYPPMRLFTVMSIITDLQLRSIGSHLHVAIDRITLAGKWASTLGDLVPNLKRIELVPFTHDSRFFDSKAALTYHYRVGMSSAHLPVRSAWLFREVVRKVINGDNVIGGIALGVVELYTRRAVSLAIIVDEPQMIIDELNLDLNDLPTTFAAVSAALQAYVARYGTGTHGGRAGPASYTIIGAGNSGGCGKRTRAAVGEKGKELPVSTVDESMSADDCETMAIALGAIGYDCDDMDQSEIEALYSELIPVLQLEKKVQELGLPDLDDLLVDNPAVNQPHVASAVLHVFDSEPDPLRLRQVLFEQLTKLSATPGSSYMNEAMPSMATTADQLTLSSGSSAISAAIPPVAHGTDSPVGTPLEPAQGAVADKGDSSTAHTVVAPSKKSGKDYRPPAAPQPYNPFLAAMSALNADEAKYGGQKHLRKQSNENEQGKGRPIDEREADSESPTPNAPRQGQSLELSGPSAQDAQAIASLSEAASPVEETIAGVDGHLAVASISELARSSPERKRSLDLVSPDIALPSPKQSRYAAPSASSARTAILDGHDNPAWRQRFEALGSMAPTPGGGPSAGHRDPRVASTSLLPDEQPAAAGPSSWRGASEARHSYASDPTDSSGQEWQTLEPFSYGNTASPARPPPSLTSDSLGVHYPPRPSEDDQRQNSSFSETDSAPRVEASAPQKAAGWRRSSRALPDQATSLRLSSSRPAGLCIATSVAWETLMSWDQAREQKDSPRQPPYPQPQGLLDVPIWSTSPSNIIPDRLKLWNVVRDCTAAIMGAGTAYALVEEVTGPYSQFVAAMRSVAFPAGPGKLSRILTCSDQNRLLTLPRREGRPGPDGGGYTADSGLSKIISEEAVWSEVCYVDLYAAKERHTLQYSKELVAKDASAHNIYISDGYKKDVDGNDFYYLEYCYRSGGVKGETRTNRKTSADALEVDPFGRIVRNLDINGPNGSLLSGLVGGSRLVFGTPEHSLFKRQGGTAQDEDSALDDLNRVSEAIGGPENVLDLSTSGGAPAEEPGTDFGAGDPGKSDVPAPEGSFGNNLPLGSGVGGNPARRPSPSSTGPTVFRLSTVNVETAIVHSDSRHTPTAAKGVDPFFATPSSFVAATPSSFVAATPSLGQETVHSASATLAPVGTSALAGSASSPLTVFVSTSSPASLFITVGGAPSPTGSVTTVA